MYQNCKNISNTKFPNSNGPNVPQARKSGARLESGSGSGDLENGAGSGVGGLRKRKTRRGKPKRRRPNPYSEQQQQSSFQRMRCRARNRHPGAAKMGGRHPRAPNNTNEFLFADHTDIPDLEQKLAGVVTSDGGRKAKPARTRDSSFSIDSFDEDEYFYSSPEDEEDFLTKEFSTAYEDLHAERLGSLSKSELIQEYVQLEAKMELLSKRLRTRTSHQLVDEKLKLSQQRIDDLLQQNDKLRRENKTLRKRSGKRGSDEEGSSSLDSDSDSSTGSSNGNGSGCCDCTDCSLSSNSTDGSLVCCKSELANGHDADAVHAS